MSIEANKAAVIAFFDAFNRHDLSLVEACVSPDIIYHPLAPNIPPTWEGLKGASRMLLSAFPDQHTAIHAILAEGDRVAVRHTHHGTHQGELMGIPPTGKTIAVDGIEIFRVQDGKIVEFWHRDDLLGLMQQLGVA